MYQSLTHYGKCPQRFAGGPPHNPTRRAMSTFPNRSDFIDPTRFYGQDSESCMYSLRSELAQ